MGVFFFLLTWMSTQGMALKATDWRRELLGDTGSISRQESSLVLWLSFEELWWWWYSGLFELDEIWLVLDNSLSVMLDEILLKLAANLSMRKVSLILGLSQLFDLRSLCPCDFIEIWCQYKKLEIKPKPCGLDSRIRDMEADLFFWWTLHGGC